jgi:hypothetical protein
MGLEEKTKDDEK